MDRSIIKHVNSDEELETMIKGLGSDRCCVIYFFLPWCGSCQKINPLVEGIAEKYPKTLFIKVDAEKCVAATKRNKVMRVPLFILYNNKTRVDRVEGASPVELESKVRRIQNDLEYKKSGGFGPIVPVPQVYKLADVSPYFDKKNCKALNDLVPTAFNGFLDGKKLISGKGVGRLLLYYAFTEKMVLQSFKLKAPVHSGPKILRFFVNIHKPLDLALVSQMTSSQEITLSEEDLTGDHAIDLRQGGYVGVTSLQIYIPENMTKSRRIEIDHLTFNGAPLSLSPYASVDPEYFANSSNKTEASGNRSNTNNRAGGSGAFGHAKTYRK